VKPIIRTLLCSFLVSFAAIASGERPTIPAGIRYKFMDDKQETEFREHLALSFQDGQLKVQSLFKGVCICAPGYWSSLKMSLAGKIKNPATSSFVVPDTRTGKSSKLEGATIEDQEDLQLLSEQFAKDVGTKPVVRRLNPEEISLFWALIPFDIEEPVCILEVGSRRYLASFVKDTKSAEYHILWLDELSQYHKSIEE